MSNTVNLEIQNSIQWNNIPCELKRLIIKDLTDAQVAKVALCCKESLSEADRKEAIFQRGYVNERELKSLIKKYEDFYFDKSVILNLPRSKITEKEFLIYLSKFSNLTGIDLSLKKPESSYSIMNGKREWGNSRKNWFHKLTNLKVIKLSGNGLENDDYIEIIKKSTNIETLMLNKCPNLKGSLSLKHLTGIKTLSIYESRLEVKSIFEDRLEELHINHTDFQKESSWLSKCTNLTSLTVGSYYLADVSPLAVLTKLKRLDIRNFFAVAKGDSLKNLTNLEQIGLPRDIECKIDDIAPHWQKVKVINCFLSCEEIAKLKNLEAVSKFAQKDEYSIGELLHLTSLQSLKTLVISSKYKHLDSNAVFKALPKLEILETYSKYSGSKDSLITRLAKIKKQAIDSSPNKRHEKFINPKSQSK